MLCGAIGYASFFSLRCICIYIYMNICVCLVKVGPNEFISNGRAECKKIECATIVWRFVFFSGIGLLILIGCIRSRRFMLHSVHMHDSIFDKSTKSNKLKPKLLCDGCVFYWYKIRLNTCLYFKSRKMCVTFGNRINLQWQTIKAIIRHSTIFSFYRHTCIRTAIYTCINVYISLYYIHQHQQSSSHGFIWAFLMIE